jgi:hypothetical protein
MTGEQLFPDTAFAIAQRNAAALAAAAQNVANNNISQAKKEAIKHVEKGRFTTVPTSINQSTIGRANVLGYNAPTVTSMRGLKPNGAVQRAMSPSLQVTSPFTQGTSNGNLNQGITAQSSDRSRAFLTGNQNKRIV